MTGLINQYPICSIQDTKSRKVLRSPHVNYIFDKTNGYMATWGRTKEEDPDYSDVGPFILDIEITEKCGGVGPQNQLCNYCFPPDAKVMILTDGTVKNIQDLKKGDKVVSFNIELNKTTINEIQELYTRDYDGILIIIELENGLKLRLTPEHPIYINNIGWTQAKYITCDSDIKIFEI